MRFLLLCLILLPLSVFARDWNVDITKSSLTFHDTYQNGPFTGKFARFEAAIAFDESDLSKDKFDVTVDMSSVDTQSVERDDTLRTTDFFDTANFAQAHFVTQSFGKGDDGGLVAHGTLTIRDQAKPATLKVKFVGGGQTATLDVETTLNRLDFGLGSSNDWADIGHDVTVQGHLALTAK